MIADKKKKGVGVFVQPAVVQTRLTFNPSYLIGLIMGKVNSIVYLPQHDPYHIIGCLKCICMINAPDLTRAISWLGSSNGREFWMPNNIISPIT